jgi:hypothetical protein
VVGTDFVAEAILTAADKPKVDADVYNFENLFAPFLARSWLRSGDLMNEKLRRPKNHAANAAALSSFPENTAPGAFCSFR